MQHLLCGPGCQQEFLVYHSFLIQALQGQSYLLMENKINDLCFSHCAACLIHDFQNIYSPSHRASLPSPFSSIPSFCVYLSLSCRQRTQMGPSQFQTSNSTVIPLLSTFTVMYGALCWTGSKRRPPWPWHPETLCRVVTQTVRRRRSTVNLLSNSLRLAGHRVGAGMQ